MAIDWAKTIALVIFLVLTIRAFVVEAYVVKGSSMETTFEDGERLLVSKFTPALDGLERGDIVVFEDPGLDRKRLIKRIVGLPGETIDIEDDVVYVDGEPLEEPYLDDSLGPQNFYLPEPVEVPDGEYFVLGDHRAVSHDSREPRIGCIPEELIVGRAVFLFYPVNKLRFF